MITTNWINSFPMPLYGMATSQSASVVTAATPEQLYDICPCFGECDYIELAFVNDGGDEYKNDKKSILWQKIFSADTITFQLLKSGVVVATLNSTAYGDYFDFGELYHPTYKGMVVDWNLVQQAFGYGKYTLKIVHVSLGTTYNIESHTFHVIEYNSWVADGTVRIENYQNGYIVGGWDYTNLNWYQSTRITGKFGNKIPTLTTEVYQNSQRREEQIQDSIRNTYELVTHLLPSQIGDFLNEDAILSNHIFITDYNIKNQKLYRQYEVRCVGISEVENHNKSRVSNYVYEFTDSVQNIVKRNKEGQFGTLPFRTIGTQTVEIKNLIFSFEFEAGTTETLEYTVRTNRDGTFTSISDDGGSGTITFKINGGAYTSFTSPLVLEVGDTIQAKRTISTSDGWVDLDGTYE